MCVCVCATCARFNDAKASPGIIWATAEPTKRQRQRQLTTAYVPLPPSLTPSLLLSHSLCRSDRVAACAGSMSWNVRKQLQFKYLIRELREQIHTPSKREGEGEIRRQGQAEPEAEAEAEAETGAATKWEAAEKSSKGNRLSGDIFGSSTT